MQDPGVNMTEHAITELMGIEQGTKLGDIVRQMLWRHTGILDEGNRLGRTFGVAQQADRLLAHGVDTLDTLAVATALVADDARLAGAGQLLKLLTEPRHTRLDLCLILTGKLDDIQPLQRTRRAVVDQIAYRVPDDILACQIQHPRIHGLHRQGAGLQHQWRVTQRRIEAVILHIHQAANTR